MNSNHDQSGSASDAKAPDPAATEMHKAVGLWDRITEHKILQWGLGYLGAALALAHGQELLAETYEWPHVIGQVVMGVLIIGLPIVLTLAWYHGHKGLKRISTAEAAIIALLLVVGGGGFFIFVHPYESHGGLERPATATTPAIQSPTAAANTGSSASPRANSAAPPAEAGVSLAVLPFVNMSDDKEQEYFSDGLSEELLNQLAQIKNLRVAGRTSSFAFKGKNEDLRTIAQELGVNHLLEGSVRKAGNQIRITAQLINGADGSHLWSQSYDRELKDVFQVQEDIAKDVAQAMSVALGVGETARPEGGTSNVEAYDKYLRGKALAYQLGPVELAKAIQLFKEAVALDPNFALAWLELYRALTDSLAYIPENAAAESRAMAEASAHITALASDAWWTQSMLAIQFASEQRWAEALAAAKKGVEGAPSGEPGAAVTYALVLDSVGQTNIGLAYLQKASKADPLSLLVSGYTQITLDVVGRFNEAEAEYLRSNDLAGDHARWDWFQVLRLWRRKSDARAVDAQFNVMLRHESLPLKLNHILAGKLTDVTFARMAIRQAAVAPENQDFSRQYQIAFYADHYGDKDVLLESLRHGVTDPHNPISAGVLWWRWETRGVGSDPRFKALVRAVKLVDYWRASGNWGDYCHPIGSDDFECR